MKKALIVLMVLAALMAWFALDLGQYLTLDAIKHQQARVDALYAEHPLWLIGGYFLLYVLVAALSLPGAALLTLLGGAVFGLVTGTLVVSFASSLGATLAMLVSRTLFRDLVSRRFAGTLDRINAGIDRDGAFYLFSLRLVPVFPFFVINLVMGLTRLPARRFYWVSQLGMLPGTLVYVNAGRELGQLDSLRGILSPGLLFAFVLLAVFPWLARAVLHRVRARQLYRRWKKPAQFDRNLIVIGAGAAGLVTSYIAAAVKARVTLIEAGEMGGDCLNTGCVPSKALIRSAVVMQTLREAEQFGIRAGTPAVEFAQVMARLRDVIQRIAPHDSVARYESLGVECLRGHARLTSPWTVSINGRTLSARHIVIATGARPRVPPIPGLADSGYLTSETLWHLEALPARLLVMGGGAVGVELAQAFARLGSAVTVIETAPRLLPREDQDVSEAVATALRADGVTVMTGYRVLRVEQQGGARRLHCGAASPDGEPVTVSGDALLVAVGREARTEGMGLEALGLLRRDDGTLDTDAHLQTRLPNILACGDVTGPWQFTHVAGHQAWYAAVNALFGFARRFKVDYQAIPFVTFSAPEVARVGLNESEAQAQGVAYELTRYDFAELDRAIADGCARGWVSVLTVPGKDRILGVTIVGDHAAEMIAEYVLAMKHGLGLNKVLGTVHAYPTFMEGNKYVAGEWKRAHAPAWALRLLTRFHQWRLR
ncbi:mercuric reductase [Alcanivorax sp. S71-1-4]|uniref:FAD-dependent oxidoreductase n=1 Tax=Alcanivorax sp. S71-1-4 TaxID=1177159 RepID=UPI001357276A|nr:bifunctional TVP38/TMEM64 family protein/FAD-dependent oxidoreductase [Alcanivorax sp. S71-1-4]KAF0807862.1 mercuric reductase [Alcanivorax sp. S71-1-4]